jgi:tRNA pseudouridine38-40 synthase
MPRYFIETGYRGTAYSGFQVQQNSNTIQSEIEKALEIFFKQPFSLTGASRTDAGVHALQNYFHFDMDGPGTKEGVSGPGQAEADDRTAGSVYNLNAILPRDIVIKRVFRVKDDAHCRFDARSREYRYFIYRDKNPFLDDRAYYYPFALDQGILEEAAGMVLRNRDFAAFSKRNTQVSHFMCEISESGWIHQEETLIYRVKANRFLRGMVKGLVGTMLRAGTRKISLDQFRDILQGKDASKADFSVPPHALFLYAVNYPDF